ncbi:MAG: Ig-like domain-containing protein [Clostridia bacterium]|nr:Ig-like domain-containing protein [Clostridia bacterium]
MKKTFRSILCVVLSLIMLCGALTPAVFAAIDDPLGGRLEKNAVRDINSVQEDAGYQHADKFLGGGYTIAEMIDVSSHNGSINWSAVAASGIKYAIIRAGWRGYGSDGSLNTDKTFAENIRGAIAAGINVGVYFYTQETNNAEAVAEAEYTLGIISGYDLKLPVAYDCEFASSGGSYTGRFYEANLTSYQIASMCNAFCERIKAAGYDAIVYANPYMLTSKINVSALGSTPIWLASYSETAKWDGDYIMWQYTGKGTCDGITGYVDRSFYYIKEGTKIDDFRIHSSKTTVYLGETAQLSAFIDRDYYTSLGCRVSDVTWTTSDEAVMTVSPDGTLTAAATGQATITGTVTVSVPNPDAPGTYVDMVLTKYLNLSASEKPPEPVPGGTDLSGMLEMLLNFFMMLAKFFVNLFTSIAGRA